VRGAILEAVREVRVNRFLSVWKRVGVRAGRWQDDFVVCVVPPRPYPLPPLPKGEGSFSDSLLVRTDFRIHLVFVGSLPTGISSARPKTATMPVLKLGYRIMEWVQVYDPLGSAVWSPVAAGLPIVVLLGLLVLGAPAPRSALAGLVTALAVAIGIFKMPLSPALAAAACGGCFGLLPIGWIVLSAVFLYHLTVRTGQFEIVKRSVTAISPDQRMQALLIAFSFGTFLEGAAGFGTPVAISAALLIGLGFSPLYAAVLALLANTSPVAFGGLGLPITTLSKVSGIDEMALSQMAGRQLPLFSLIIPAWLVAVMS